MRLFEGTLANSTSVIKLKWMTSLWPQSGEAGAPGRG